MKKYISLILLIITLTTGNGYYLYFTYLQHNVQQDIKSKLEGTIPNKNLSIIVITNSNNNKIFWTRKDKEFRYEGKMFDIVKVKIKNNKTYYYCLNDVNENILVANFLKNNKRINKILLKLRKILINKYLPKDTLTNKISNKTNILFCIITEHYKSKTINIISPPPQTDLI